MSAHLFVISGPSGAGKGTIRNKVLVSTDKIAYSISCTTREPRLSETNGVDYYFISKDEFKKYIERGMFLEYACVHGNYYGTRKDIVQNTLAQGTDVLLEIDVQGALQVKEKMPEAVTIFILPPDETELEARLRGRGSESEDQILLRLRNAKDELDAADKYDYRIVNNVADTAAEEFKNIINSHRRG